MRLLVILPALVMLALVFQDAFEVMLLPRRVHRRLRLMRLFFEAAWTMWSQLALRIAPGHRRERFLSVFGALSMMTLFGCWASGLIAGFGVLEWALQSGPASTLPEQVYMSGVTFFTLGYGDVVPHSASARAVAVLEAGTGIGFIATVIGYLPVLYQLFARREAHVVQLDGRAGSPPTAGTMLCRHAAELGKLDELLREWEVWGGELLESHLSYPMLVYYRSQHDDQSWLTALTAIMDTCALILVGVDGMGPLQARMTFTMARQVLVEMARSVQAKPSPYRGGDRLDDAGFAHLVAAFAGCRGGLGRGTGGARDLGAAAGDLRAAARWAGGASAAAAAARLDGGGGGDGPLGAWPSRHGGPAADRGAVAPAGCWRGVSTKRGCCRRGAGSAGPYIVMAGGLRPAP